MSHQRPSRTLLTPSQASEYLQLSQNTLAKMRIEGEGPPFFKLGSRVRYDIAEMETWLRNRLRTSTSYGQ